MSTRNLSRMNDYFARYLLGRQGKEVLLLSFINSVMRDSGYEEFRAITIRNPYNLKEHATDSETIVDVKATTSSGEKVIVEVQVKGSTTFFDRTLEYWAKNYRSETRKNKDGKKVKKLSTVISINLLAFTLFDWTDLAHTSHKVCCVETGHVTSNKLLFHFLELPKALKGVREEELDTWLRFFGTKDFEKEKQMIAKKGEVFEMAVEDYETFRENEDLVSEYEKRETFLLGQQLMIDEATENGISLGFEQGTRETKISVVKNFLAQGLSITQIAAGTGLTEEEVRAINNS